MTAVIVLGASPGQMGLLQALGGASALLAGPIAGILADRCSRKPILISADLLRAGALAVIPLAAALGRLSLPVLIAVTAVTGFLTVLFDVAYQSIVPSLVARKQLLDANSKLAISSSTAEVIGPAITGVLVQAFTAPRAVLLDSLSFLVSAASLLWMKVKETAREHSEGPGRGEITAGMRYVAHHALLRPLALRTVCFAFFGGWIGPLYVLFAVRDLGMSPAVLGLVIAVGGVSNFIGAMLAGRIDKWFATGPVLIAATFVAGVTVLLIPLARGPVLGVLILSFCQLLGDVSFPVYSVQELTLRQTVASAAMLGRINAFMQMLFKGIFPLGAIFGGQFAEMAGIRSTFALAGIGILGGGVLLLFSDIRKADLASHGVRPAGESDSAA